ncbi:DUF4381 domain-containing protein [Microvirga subterranea]|uniref:Uncharacterized protein DUF4381 n=1 Tax=Microvirga subterranea TaxID=186651 RepID=A0A370HH96_9HYPH|nr:DUF4381 domain-containing protein [Microvirga subterranea]RDI57191.1 uncharacterized protein DUF4381 [Microvirga subterranea]
MSGDPADLANLRDIVLPESAPWWPLAPGAWIVLAGLLAALLVASIHAYRRHKANAYRREAVRELAALTDMRGVLPILKRAAITAYGREQVASLSGTAFLDFLDRTGGTTAFTAGPARLLPDLTFASRGTIPATDLTTAVADAGRWLRIHRAREG